MSRLIVPLLWLLSLYAVSAPAASLKVEFSGTFGEGCYGGCANPPENELFALIGTTFSGEFIFPDVGADELPDDPIRGLYSFGSGTAGFRFDSEIDAFDIVLPEVTVIVRDCDDPTYCELNVDSVWLNATSAAHEFDLALNAYGPGDWSTAFSGDEIPSLAELRHLVTNQSPNVQNFGFSVYTAGYGGGVDTWTAPSPAGMQVTISAVPIPSTGWLFGSALGLLSWKRRKIG